MTEGTPEGGLCLTRQYQSALRAKFIQTLADTLNGGIEDLWKNKELKEQLFSFLKTILAPLSQNFQIHEKSDVFEIVTDNQTVGIIVNGKIITKIDGKSIKNIVIKHDDNGGSGLNITLDSHIRAIIYKGIIIHQGMIAKTCDGKNPITGIELRKKASYKEYDEFIFYVYINNGRIECTRDDLLSMVDQSDASWDGWTLNLKLQPLAVRSSMRVNNITSYDFPYMPLLLALENPGAAIGLNLRKLAYTRTGSEIEAQIESLKKDKVKKYAYLGKLDNTAEETKLPEGVTRLPTAKVKEEEKEVLVGGELAFAIDDKLYTHINGQHIISVIPEEIDGETVVILGLRDGSKAIYHAGEILDKLGGESFTDVKITKILSSGIIKGLVCPTGSEEFFEFRGDQKLGHSIY